MKRDVPLTLLSLLLLITLVGLLLTERGRSSDEGNPIDVTTITGQPTPTGEENAYRKVYDAASRGVAHITTRRLARSFFGIEPEEGSGSGFLIDPSGVLLTNYHVVEGANEVRVAFPDGSEFDAEWFRAEPSLDLAVVKIDPGQHSLHPLTLGESSSLQIGQRVVAIGNPFGLSGTLTVGVVSALGRDIRTEGNRIISDVIQTDASINPGNSGGPLLNLDGRVIGINTAIFSPSGGSVGIGFAIGIDNVVAALPRMRAGQAPAARGWLGVHLADLPPSVAGRLEGVLVRRVVRTSPADRAGLIRGHIIQAIDGRRIESAQSLIASIAESPPGTRIALEVFDLDLDRTVTVEVELGRRLE